MSEYTRWNTSHSQSGAPLNFPNQFNDSLGGQPLTHDTGSAEDHLDTLYRSGNINNLEDEPWTPMRMTRAQTHASADSGGGLAHFPTLPPISNLPGISERQVMSRQIRTHSYSFSEPSWITTNTDGDIDAASTAFSERETVLSAGSTYASTTGGRGGSGGVSTTQWRCEECDKTFTSRGGLSKHKKVGQHGQRSHKCPKCGASFDMSKDLNRHIATKHKTEGNTLFCHIQTCNRSYSKAGKGFSRYDNLRQHVKMRHGVEEFKNMPKGGHRVSITSVDLASRSGDMLSNWNTGAGQLGTTDNSLDMLGYPPDEEMEEDDQDEDDEMPDDPAGPDSEFGFAHESDITFHEDHALASRENRGETHDTVSFTTTSMGPPPVPKKSSKSPEKVGRRVSWAGGPPEIWPRIEEPDSGSLHIHGPTLEVAEEAQGSSPRSHLIEASYGDAAGETSDINMTAAEHSAAASSPQRAGDLVNAKSIIEGEIRNLVDNGDSVGLLELRKWLDECVKKVIVHTSGSKHPQIDDDHSQVGASTFELTDENSAAITMNIPLGNSRSGSIGGRSQASSQPNVAASSYAPSSIGIFTSTEGSISPLTSVKDLLDAAGSIISPSEAALSTPVPAVQDMMNSNLLPSLASLDQIFAEDEQNPSPSGMMLSNVTSGNQSQQVKRTCFCGKSFTKVSEYNKHYKRHWKRFLCPFPGCMQRFGTKDDWRRHDSRCHYQPGFYKCLFGGHPSCRTAFTKELFDAHLDGIHLQRSPPVSPPDGTHHQMSMALNATPAEIQRQKDILLDPERRKSLYKRSHNGQNNCEDNFWCGFCRKLIKIEDADCGLKAMNNRVDHISQHFTNESSAGAAFDEGAAAGSAIPPLTTLPLSIGGGVPLPLPGTAVATTTGGDGQAGSNPPAGPKWMHYDDYDMRDSGPYTEDGQTTQAQAPPFPAIAAPIAKGREQN